MRELWGTRAPTRKRRKRLAKKLAKRDGLMRPGPAWHLARPMTCATSRSNPRKSLGAIARARFAREVEHIAERGARPAAAWLTRSPIRVEFAFVGAQALAASLEHASACFDRFSLEVARSKLGRCHPGFASLSEPRSGLHHVDRVVMEVEGEWWPERLVYVDTADGQATFEPGAGRLSIGRAPYRWADKAQVSLVQDALAQDALAQP